MAKYKHVMMKMVTTTTTTTTSQQLHGNDMTDGKHMIANWNEKEGGLQWLYMLMVYDKVFIKLSTLNKNQRLSRI